MLVAQEFRHVEQCTLPILREVVELVLAMKHPQEPVSFELVDRCSHTLWGAQGAREKIQALWTKLRTSVDES